MKRRRILQVLGAGLTTTFAGCPGDLGNEPSSTSTGTRSPTDTATPTDTTTASPTETVEEETETATEEWTVVPVEHDKLIGAVYKVNFRGEDGYINLDHPWHDYISLDPVLGQYRSRDSNVGNQHVK